MSSFLEELETDDLVEVESGGGTDLGSLITSALSSLAAHEPISGHESSCAVPSTSISRSDVDVVLLDDSDTESEVAADGHQQEAADADEVVEVDSSEEAEEGDERSHATAARSSSASACSPPKRSRGRPRMQRPLARVEREVAVQNAEAMLADLVIRVRHEYTL